jgi:hypothetical protein
VRIKKGHTAGSLAIIFIYLALTVKAGASIISTLPEDLEPWFSDFVRKFHRGLIGIIKDRQFNSTRGKQQLPMACNRSRLLSIVMVKASKKREKRFFNNR